MNGPPPVLLAGNPVAPLALGTWQWGDRFVWGYGRGYADPDLREAFRASIAAGVSLVDTAEVYGMGRAERLLGACIRETGAQVLVATKCFPFPWRTGRWGLRLALARSLRRLGMAAVDVYMMHWPFGPVAIETWMDAMADAVKAGLVRAVGVSNYSLDQVRRAQAALARRGLQLACVQVKLNLLERDVLRTGLLQTCLREGIAVLAYSPLAMGVLTGTYSAHRPPPGWRGRRYAPLLRRAQPVLDLVREIATSRGASMAQVALAWVIAKGAVAIAGAKTGRQAADNAAVLRWTLRPEEVRALDEAWP
ncbi:MAG: aldo/keto reductase [Armatimonadota bacterium]|nr:aldo/keto reductase [Armatimonadota bacterium]